MLAKLNPTHSLGACSPFLRMWCPFRASRCWDERNLDHGGFNFPWHWFYAGPTLPTQVSLLGCAVCHFPISVLSSHTTRTEPPGRWKLVNGKLVKRIFQRNENRIPFWATTARRTPSRIRVPQKKWRDVEQPPPKHGVYWKHETETCI